MMRRLIILFGLTQVFICNNGVLAEALGPLSPLSGKRVYDMTVKELQKEREDFENLRANDKITRDDKAYFAHIIHDRLLEIEKKEQENYEKKLLEQAEMISNKEVIAAETERKGIGGKDTDLSGQKRDIAGVKPGMVASEGVSKLLSEGVKCKLQEVGRSDGNFGGSIYCEDPKNGDRFYIDTEMSLRSNTLSSAPQWLKDMKRPTWGETLRAKVASVSFTTNSKLTREEMMQYVLGKFGKKWSDLKKRDIACDPNQTTKDVCEVMVSLDSQTRIVELGDGTELIFPIFPLVGIKDPNNHQMSVAKESIREEYWKKVSNSAEQNRRNAAYKPRL